MEDRRGAGKHGNGLRLGEESLMGNGDGIFAQRNGLEMELAFGVSLHALRKFRVARFDNYGDARDGAVLQVVHNASDAAKNRGQGPGSRE